MKAGARREPAEKPQPADPALFTFFNEIGIIAQLARNRFERALPDGLRLAQFSVLNHMARLGDGRSPLALARAFQVTKGAMTNTLRRLEARGLIRVVPDAADGRGKRVLLTEKGRRVREACIAGAFPAFARFAPRAEAMAAALPFLQSLRAELDAARDPPAR